MGFSCFLCFHLIQFIQKFILILFWENFTEENKLFESMFNIINLQSWFFILFLGATDHIIEHPGLISQTSLTHQNCKYFKFYQINIYLKMGSIFLFILTLNWAEIFKAYILIIGLINQNLWSSIGSSCARRNLLDNKKVFLFEKLDERAVGVKDVFLPHWLYFIKLYKFFNWQEVFVVVLLVWFHDQIIMSKFVFLRIIFIV